MKEKFSDKILCVDDEENILHLFRRTLGREYQLFTANSARNALDLISQHPDFAVILSDYNMPGINGVEFLKLAQLASPESIQIMLTGSIELDVAIQAINETKVFRYLPKPCPMEILRKVISDALDQYRLFIDKQRLTLELEEKNCELLEVNNTLSKQKYLLEQELEMAKTVYMKVTEYGHASPDGLDYFIAAKEVIGGDFLLTHASESKQSFYFMMGDLTGHGLQSALAILLVAEVFDDLCIREPDIEQLAKAINDKMCRKLPTGLFCTALLGKINMLSKQLISWQGGMPDAYLLNDRGEIVKSLHSNNLPLGIHAAYDFSRSSTCHDLKDVASLFICSDGVTEQRNPDQVMFGSERLIELLHDTPPGKRRIDQAIQQLSIHRQTQPQCDDISLCELHFKRIIEALKLS